ncbi:hypothetical protein [Streptomyces sp. Da 82-17]|uniref:hypothetical protein n=1 Tax=Streptomyces sp. Da 82-17 TaxID=3377116 RepID=UPI0038D4A121
MSDKPLQRALGTTYRAEMSCGDLGKAIRQAATGPTPGEHTLREARVMQASLTAVGKEIEQQQEPTIAQELRTPVAAALADYAQDTGEILNAVNDAYIDHEDDGAWQDGKTVRMSAPLDELIDVLRALSQSPDAYADLRAAHVRQCAVGLAAVPSRAAGPTYTAPGRNCAAGLGYYDGIAEDIPDSQSKQWRSDVLQRLRNSMGTPPAYSTDPAQHITASWQRDAVRQVKVGGSGFLTDDSTRILDIWATARGDDLDARKLDALQEDMGSDACSRAEETTKQLACTREPSKCP